MRRIAIPFELDENWVGGSYYIRNLISALALLPAEDQPFIFLVSEKPESIRFIQEVGYPKLGWIKNQQFQELVDAEAVDVVFPHPIGGQDARTISWIPDFQELHLGYFFADDEIARRRDHHRRRFATAGLIVSSEDVRNDVHRFYPGECEHVAVVRFASFDRFDPEKIEETRKRYNLPARYVFCANQVWLHKNHILVIRAVALLKSMGVDVTVVFTGNEADYRVMGYAAYLKQQVVEWGIQDQVHFLGFIPRADQLCLMKGAHYIVQPSLFEGWSTVIEDAKSMGKFVVASDLAVHKEQLTEASRFFFRHDPLALAEIMKELNSYDTLPVRAADYTESQRRFGRDFMDAIEQFLPEASHVAPDQAMALIGKMSDRNLATLDQSLPAAPPAPTKPKADVPAQAVVPEKPVAKSNILPVQATVDDRGEAYRALMIFTTKPIGLNAYYEKFLLKLLFIKGDILLELRSGSIVPSLISEANAHGQDTYGQFMRIGLRPNTSKRGMTGTLDSLSSEAREDINTMLLAGLNHLQGGKAKVPDFLRPILDGVRLESGS